MREMRGGWRLPTKPERWVERLVLGYAPADQNVQDFPVKAEVVGLTESQSVEGAACLMFLSDGVVFMPALLTDVAWERLQELEERDCFTGLENAIVSVQKFSLHFHMEPELVGHVSASHLNEHTLCCKWALKKSTPNLPSQSKFFSDPGCLFTGFQLSNLMGMWQNDIISGMQNEIIDRLNMPGTSEQSVTALTGWHQDRLLYKVSVSVKVSLFNIDCFLYYRSTSAHLNTISFVSSVSATPEDLQPQQNQLASVTLKNLSASNTPDTLPCEQSRSQPLSLPVATGTKKELLNSSGAEKAEISLLCGQQPLSLQSNPSHSKRKLSTQEELEEDEEDDRAAGSPPTWLAIMQQTRCSNDEGNGPKRPTLAASVQQNWVCYVVFLPHCHCRGSKPNCFYSVFSFLLISVFQIHPDGSSFSYRYKPSAHVAMALCQFKYVGYIHFKTLTLELKLRIYVQQTHFQL
uniref:Shelterin complex subunit TPP1/Est3 domain-containing protein n=1 Tax=Denticeps clupeoides TaxID=299321 RepID=A0AAY4EYT4_9TELE